MTDFCVDSVLFAVIEMNSDIPNDIKVQIGFSSEYVCENIWKPRLKCLELLPNLIFLRILRWMWPVPCEFKASNSAIYGDEKRWDAKLTWNDQYTCRIYGFASRKYGYWQSW